ncbi:DUF4352 domain-containing protein [Kitasatospora sp. NPDC093550]|uniref:DUF4352 domain-containing protein n=1 Tax=Kitasatospora sp. NPDC093550 TaxID=3364089 RepID=UPI0038295423
MVVVQRLPGMVGLMRRVVVLAWGLPLVALAVGCSNGQSVVTSPQSGPVTSAPFGTASTPPGQATPSTPAVATPVAASIGSTLTLPGQKPEESEEVTVVKVVDPARAKETFESPAAGTRLVAVQFRLHNTGTAVYKDSPSNGARLVDSEGQQFTASVATETSAGPGFPGSVTVPPGDTALGYITFAVPASSTVAKIQFTLDSGFAPSTGQWTVS